MNAVNRSELGPLFDHVQAVRRDAPPQDATDRARRVLQRRLSDEVTAGRRRPSRPRAHLAWATPALAVVVAALVLFAGGPSGPGTAFAEVQRYFMDFDTLHATTRVEVTGQSGWVMDIYLRRGGRTRIDMGEITSYVIDPERGAMLTLLHQASAAQRIEIPTGSSPRQELEWLETIRRFQGEAESLPQAETIRGRLAAGYRLDQNGHAIVVWADAEDGTPLRLEGAFGKGEGESMNMTIDFTFDQPLADALFDLELPAGYRWLQSIGQSDS